MKSHQKIMLISACGVVAVSAVMIASNVEYLRTENGITSIMNNGPNTQGISEAKSAVQTKNGDITLKP